MDLSIIIVSYNTYEYTNSTLKSIENALKKTPLYKVEVLLIDNASADGSAQLLQKYTSPYFTYRFFKNTVNVGFAKANNQLLTYATGEFVLYLNSDMDISNVDFLQLEAFYSKHSDCGILTPKVVLESGQLDMACHRGFPTPWASFCYFAGLEKLLGGVIFGGYHQTYKNLNSTHKIDACTGAFMFLKASLAKSLKGFDEQFFMYGEDLDFALRAKRDFGLGVYFNPAQTVIHKKNKSGMASPNPKTRNFIKWHFYDAMQKFYVKHYKRFYPFFVNYVVLRYINYKKSKFKNTL